MADTSLEPRDNLGQLQAPGNLPVSAQRPPRGAGGTPGGIGTFLLGFVLAAAGAYLILEQVTVTGAFGGFSFGGYRGGFGLVMIPFLTGLVGLAMDAKSKLAWLLLIGGGAIIGASILMNMSIYFRSTSLFSTLMMFGMLAIGLGMVIRALRPYPEK